MTFVSLPQANIAGYTKKTITYCLLNIGYSVGNLIGPQVSVQIVMASSGNLTGCRHSVATRRPHTPAESLPCSAVTAFVSC